MGRNGVLEYILHEGAVQEEIQAAEDFLKLSQVNSGYLKMIEPYIFRVAFHFDKNIQTEYISIASSSETLDDLKRLKRKCWTR